MKKTLCILISLLLVLGLAGCGGSKKEEALDLLVVGTTASFDNAEAGIYDFDMLSSGTAQPPVVALGEDGNYIPQLVNWQTEDSKTWIFTVKDGMKWSDGEELTAEDIAFAIMREEGLKEYIKSLDCQKDGKSFTIILNSPDVRFLSNMTYIRPVPTKYWTGCDDPDTASKKDDAPQVWCGPYVLDEFNKEAGTVSFTVNPYYPETPKVKNIVFRLFGSEDTMYMALQNGDIDMVWNYSAGVPVNYQSVLKDCEGVSLVSTSATNVPAALAFNNAKGPFKDLNMRLAVSYALDYNELKEYLGSEYSKTPGRSFVPAATVGYKETESLSKDSQKAEEYLKLAGFEKKNENGFYVDSNGVEAAFTLTINSSKEAHVAAGELIKTQLEEFGIRVDLENLDPTAYNAKTSNKFSENNISMEAALYGYTSAGMAMQNGLGSIYVDGDHPVQGGCQVFDETFKTLIGKLEGASTPEEYVAAAAELQDYYAQSCPVIALYQDSLIYAMSSSLGNVKIDANFGLNNMQNWFSITKN